MKKLTIFLALTLLLSGCAPRPVQAPQETLAPTDTALQDSVPALSPYPTQGSLPPEDERVYFEKSGGMMGGGSDLTEQDLRTLVVFLRLRQWENLNEVLDAFGGASIRDDNIRMCDLTEFDKDNPNRKISISYSPFIDTEKGLATITIASKNSQIETMYVLVFTLNLDNRYSLQSVVKLYNDYYYGSGGDIRFEKIADKLFLVWEGLAGHGTGGEDYLEEWYDCDTGDRVLSFTTYSSDVPYSDKPSVDKHTKQSISSDPVLCAGGFALQVTREYSIALSQDNTIKSQYNDVYPVYYDADSNSFFTTKGIKLLPYKTFAQNSNATIAAWAEDSIDNLEYWQKELGKQSLPMPSMEKRTNITFTPQNIQYVSTSNYDGFTENRIEALSKSINEKEGNGLSDILFPNGRYGDDDASQVKILNANWSEVSEIHCTVDVQTAKKREIYLNILYKLGGEHRCMLIVFETWDQPNEWRKDTILDFSYDAAHDESPIIKFYHNDNPRIRRLYIPTAYQNGYTVWQTNFDWMWGKYDYISSAYGTDGVLYSAEIDTSSLEVYYAELHVRAYTDEWNASYTAYIWEDPELNDKKLFSDDKQIDLLLSGQFEKHDGLQAAIKSAKEK